MATAQLSQQVKFLHCRGPFGAFDARAVESALQDLLTRHRPLTSFIRVHSSLDGECRSETHSLPIVTYRTLLTMKQLSLEKFRREPATSTLDWSFAPTRRSHKRFAGQHCYGLPPPFPAASSCPRVGRVLSGSPV